MSTRKVSLSLPADLLDRAEAAVEAGQARSVSAYITAAAGCGEHRTTISAMLERWGAEHGTGTAAERTAAEARVREHFARADARLAQRRAPGAA
ncbi:hypothetical protein [Nocardia sp. NPDC050435]|uniref:hypothetical protein n=1 Tax=Nocardia sp. NPDC050435 TaxID=3155040 RepID=UPI0034022119